MSPSQLWLDLFKGALGGTATIAVYVFAEGSSQGASPASLAEAAEKIADEGVKAVNAKRGLDAPVDKLLRAVDGIGLYSDYPPDLKARLHTVFEAAAAVKASRAS